MIASLVVNGRAELHVPPRPAEVLRLFPTGPYTVTVIQQHCIEAWERHVERLTQAIETLCDAIKDGNHSRDALYAGLAARLELSRGEQSLHTYILNLIKPSIKLAEFHNQVQPGSKPDAPMLLTVLLHPRLEDRGSPLAVVVHTLQVQRPALHATVAIQLVGSRRQLPTVKHSQWALDRQPLEAVLDEGVAEGVLTTPDGCLLEGLTSNVFVVVGDEGGPQHVQTAAVDDGVLNGIMRQHVIDACRITLVPCIERAPSFHERGTWKEAFVTSSMKRLQPVCSITCNSSHICSNVQWRINLPDAPGPITRRLQAEAAKLMAASCVPMNEL